MAKGLQAQHPRAALDHLSQAMVLAVTLFMINSNHADATHLAGPDQAFLCGNHKSLRPPPSITQPPGLLPGAGITTPITSPGKTVSKQGIKSTTSTPASQTSRRRHPLSPRVERQCRPADLDTHMDGDVLMNTSPARPTQSHKPRELPGNVQAEYHASKTRIVLWPHLSPPTTKISVNVSSHPHTWAAVALAQSNRTRSGAWRSVGGRGDLGRDVPVHEAAGDQGAVRDPQNSARDRSKPTARKKKKRKPIN